MDIIKKMPKERSSILFEKILEKLKLLSAQLFPYTPLILVVLLLAVIIVAAVKSAAEKRAKKRLRKERMEKERAFTLPDRENTFVRERLDGVLTPRITDDGNAKYDVSAEKMRLEHVRRLIAKTKATNLSAADRLEINRLSKRITEIASKELLTLQETYELSDHFLAALKLAAKYAV